MNEDTRERILEAGTELIHLHGFQGTGLKAILDAANVPKGSFYHYFKSKEDFGIAVIEYYEQIIARARFPLGQDPSLTAIQCFEKLFELSRKFNAETNYSRGCLIANLSQEMSALSPPIRERLQESHRKIVKTFADIVRSGQEKGEISTAFTAEEAAVFILTCRNGALTSMKATGSEEPLLISEKFLLQYLLPA